MKKKRYERFIIITSSTLIFFFIELIFFLFLISKKIQVYKTIQGVVSNDSVILFLCKEDRNKIYANTFLYIDGTKINYKIKDDMGVVYKDKDESYYKIFLKIKLDNYKENDSITMSIKDKKIRMIEMFHIILEGD